MSATDTTATIPTPNSSRKGPEAPPSTYPGIYAFEPSSSRTIYGREGAVRLQPSQSSGTITKTFADPFQQH